MSKFKTGDIIKCNGEHFAEREILDDSDFEHYITRFLEDGSIAKSNRKVIDSCYWLK